LLNDIGHLSNLGRRPSALDNIDFDKRHNAEKKTGSTRSDSVVVVGIL
jgi:hypothetical protein